MPDALTADDIKAIVREGVREGVRAELAKLLPRIQQGPALLTLRECAEKFRRGYRTVRAMADRGELLSIKKPARGGGVQVMIVAADAEQKLGGGS